VQSRQISHYRITGRLGVGGMGIVYEAQDTRLHRLVALKFLPQDLAADADAVRRLRREAETIALLSHPNICTVYDIDGDDGRTFIVMERVEGVNLRTWIEGKRPSCDEAVGIAVQITEALEAAHSRGIVHRDVKAGNVMISAAGRVKLLDFGLARRFLPDGTGAIPAGSTLIGRPKGTANYMAPERILQGPPDPRSDLFSVGVMLYEMLSGALPFAGASAIETAANILGKEPPPFPKSHRQDRALERTVMRLLAKNPEARFASATEALAALRPFTEPRKAVPGRLSAIRNRRAR
jgi:serine/threonine protein kinase